MPKKTYRYEATLTLTVRANNAVEARGLAARVKAELPHIPETYLFDGVKVRAGKLAAVQTKARGGDHG